MPKAFLFKFFSIACFACFAQTPAWAQSTLGEIIEKTKNNRLNQQQVATTPSQPQMPNQAAQMPNQAAQMPNNPTASTASPLPILWSLSGVNDHWIAEVWINQAIQRFPVIPGHVLPGGWRVIEGDSKSLTLAKGRLVKLLTPAAMGSNGAEFEAIQKSTGLEANMRQFARAIESAATPLPSFGNTANTPAVNAAANLPPAR
jgi:hypothetical protein